MALQNLIKVDLDQPYSVELQYNVIRKVMFIQDILGYQFRDMRFWRSTKSGNTHFGARLDEEISQLEICCIQAILGSDFKRETFNLRRIRRGQKNWNILFEHEELHRFESV